MAKTNVGTMACSECGKEVVIKVNENETLSYTCGWCDDANYAKTGTVKHGNWKTRMVAFDAAKPEQKTKPANAGLLI